MIQIFKGNKMNKINQIGSENTEIAGINYLSNLNDFWLIKWALKENDSPISQPNELYTYFHPPFSLTSLINNLSYHFSISHFFQFYNRTTQFIISTFKLQTFIDQSSLMEFNNQNVSIYTCEFQAFVERAKVQIKFPCNYFLEWKANNAKVIVSSPNRFQANRSEILFNQTLKINVNMLFDKSSNQYLKKESLLMINLISKSRPDQVKLVGRVAVDLADVLNSKSFQNITTSQLEYCSVQASMIFCVKSISVKQSSMHVSELDRSSFNEYMSFQSNLKPHQGFIPRNEGSSTHRDFDDDRSAKGSDKGQIRSLGRDKSKMSSPTLMKTVYTPSSRQVVRMEGSIQQQAKMSRSNSVSNQLQNPNKMFPPPLNNKIPDIPLGPQSESNFSFNNSKAQEVNKSNISKAKMTSSQFLSNQEGQKSGVSSKVRSSQPVLPNQFVPMVESNQKPLKISIQRAQVHTQNMPKTQRVSSVSSPKQSQQDLLKRIKKEDQAISQRQAVIKKLQSQVQIKRHTMALQASFTSSAKDAKKLSAQLSKTNSESKRIIGLTQALNQLQTKYTNLTLETEEMRSAWKREKEELLSAVSIAEGAINYKDKEIKEKAKINQMLQYSLQQAQKFASQRLAQLIYLKSQLADSQKHSSQLSEQKNKLSTNLKKVEEQIKSIQSQTSLNQDQLNRTFGDRLALYQDKITQSQNKVNSLQKEKKTLNEKMMFMQKESNQLLLKINGLEDQNKTYLGQIQQSHNEWFGLKQENEAIRRDVLKMEKQNRQERQRIWSSKDQQVSHQLNLKNQQVSTIRQQLQQKITSLQQDSKTQLQLAHQHHLNQTTVIKQQSTTLTTKIQQLQNTILTLNDQLTSYQQNLHSLTKQLNAKSIKLQEISNAHRHMDEQKKSMQGEHQQLMLSLNSQIEEYLAKIHSLQTQIGEFKLVLQQKDRQLLKSLEQTQSHLHHLELTHAQSAIFQSKLLQQRQYYQHQSQSLKLQSSQHIYQIQIQLQQQLQKYQELQHLKEMLKQSLQEWQNKCTDDRIASSKVVGKLNDIIKEKQETMYEMENIMRHLEKEKSFMQEHLVEQTSNYHQVLNVYRVKHQELKSFVSIQQTQYIGLYQAVKQQRQNNKNKINEKQLAIKQLQSSIVANSVHITELNSQIDALTQSLQKSESLLIQTNSMAQTNISKLKNQHNQQVDQYQQRIRQLQQKILEKDNQLIDKQMALVQHEKIVNQLKTQISHKHQEINELVQKEASVYEEINKLKGEIDSINNEKQHVLQEKSTIVQQIQSLKVRLQEASQKYTQLQNTLLSYQQRQQQIISKAQQQKQLLTAQLSLLSELQQKHLQKVNSIQQNFNTQLQQLKQQHTLVLNEAITQQNLKKQQLVDKITLLQDEKMKVNQLLLQKVAQLQVITEQKNQIQQQITTLKSQRQTQVLLSYKQQVQNYKQQVKSSNEQLLQARTQLKQIPTLQRAIKIKTIQLNSLKYKSSSTSSTPNQSLDPQQLVNFQQIIKLKNQQIDSLKKDNQSMRHHQLQLYQLQSLKQQLYQSIQQYEQQKFHLNSQLNQKEINIAQLKNQLTLMGNNKTQLKEKVHQLTEKIHHYQSLILDFKGHNQMSSTKSHSDKLNTSRISSGKIIEIETDNNINTGIQTKLQIDTFIKKIKLLEGQLQKIKLKQQETNSKEEKYIGKINSLELKINELQQVIKEKDAEINKKTTAKPPTQPVKPQVTYKNPLQVANTFKEIQNLLKKRSQFHNLETTLLKLHEINFKQSIQSQKQDHQTKQKILTTGAHISLLSKEFQNLKAKIMKLQGKNYQEKAKFISLLRPCQDSIKEVSKLYETTDQSRHSSFQTI